MKLNLMEEETQKIKITEQKITIRDLVKDYEDNEEEGVSGYGGKLDIRPKYQREFIYDDKEERAVINSILHQYPIGIMYWYCPKDNKGFDYEVMDGQQRILSICKYIAGDYYIDFREFSGKKTEDPRYFTGNNLTQYWKNKILDYELTVYFCEGGEDEMLEWFTTINIAGKALAPQELLNAIYRGTFISDAKRKFSKTNCVAYKISDGLVPGKVNRQDLLEKALQWMVDHEKRTKGIDQSIKVYMAAHQDAPNANNLWTYFQNVIEWAKTNFDIHKFKEEMKGQDWAKWYDEYHDTVLDTKKLSDEILRLAKNSEIQNRKGIIPYVLTGNEQLLNLRTFPKDIALAVYAKQGHRCNECGNEFPFEEMHADHVKPWSKGGRTEESNCQLLCKECNLKKAAKENYGRYAPIIDLLHAKDEKIKELKAKTATHVEQHFEEGSQPVIINPK